MSEKVAEVLGIVLSALEVMKVEGLVDLWVEILSHLQTDMNYRFDRCVDNMLKKKRKYCRINRE